MAESDDKSAEIAGISSREVDVVAIFERLKEEVRRGSRGPAVDAQQARLGASPLSVGGADVAVTRRRARTRLSLLRRRVVSRLDHGAATAVGRVRAARGRAKRHHEVAYYSPLPPERSGIADYSALLLPALQRRLEVGIARRGRRPEAEVALYHIGNNPDFHAWIVEAMRRRPGIVVLHELVLHHLVVGMTLARGDADGYLRALEREGGPAARRLGLDGIDGRSPPVWKIEPERFPLVGEVLDQSEAIVVHSRYVEEGVRAAGFSGQIHRLQHPARPPHGVEPARIDGGPVIGSFGYMNRAKRVPQLLAAFAELRRSYADARLLLIGPVANGFDLQGELARAGLDRTDAVVRDGWVPEERFSSLMAACDICVNLRSPTMGETSGSAVRSLALGRPLVVSDIGWFAELPGDVALKVPVDVYEIATLSAALELLSGDDAARRALGEKGAVYARREHDLDRAADQYATLLATGGATVADAVAGVSAPELPIAR